MHARGLGPQIIPVFQATVAPAEPGQGDEIDLFVFAHGFDKRHELLDDRITRSILWASSASNIAGSDAPTVAYATVYPLTTLLRILSAQVLAIVLFR